MLGQGVVPREGARWPDAPAHLQSPELQAVELAKAKIFHINFPPFGVGARRYPGGWHNRHMPHVT